MNRQDDINNKIYVSDMLFIIALVIFLSANILDVTALAHSSAGDATIIKLAIKLMRYGSYLICMIKFMYDAKYDRKKLIALLAAGAVLVLSYIGASNKTMILYLILFVAAIGVSSEMIIRSSFLTQCILVGVFVVGSQLGIFNDYVRDDGGRIRHFLGFSWTTTSAIIFMFMILQYIYLKKGKINICESLIMIFISYYFYVMTDSRFAFLISVASVLFFLIFWRILADGMFVKHLKSLCVIAPWLIAIFAIWLHYMYNPDNDIMRQLNSVLSGRLKLGKSAIDTYGFSLVGKPIEWIGYSITETLKGEYNYVDCSYLQLSLEYGLLFMALVLTVYSVIIYRSIKNENYYLVWILLIILMFSISEPRLFNLAYNPFVLLIFARMDNYGHNLSVSNNVLGQRYDNE